MTEDTKTALEKIDNRLVQLKDVIYSVTHNIDSGFSDIYVQIKKVCDALEDIKKEQEKTTKVLNKIADKI